MTAPLDLGAIEELSVLLDEAMPGPWEMDTGLMLYAETATGTHVVAELDGESTYEANAKVIVALRNAAPQLLAAARRGLALESDIRAWMLALHVSCVESWCQSDRVNEALPELGELVGKHVGYPKHDEKTGELGWTPGGK